MVPSQESFSLGSCALKIADAVTLTGRLLVQRSLVIGCGLEPLHLQALAKHSWELRSVPSLESLIKTSWSQLPRLFLLRTDSSEVEAERQTLESLRRQWPLTDVLIWAPQATPAAVRALFRSSATDVILPTKIDAAIQAIAETLRHQRLLPRLEGPASRRDAKTRYEGLISCSDAMWDLFESCDRIAPSDATVLIVGETGTGKELLARAVHRRSGRVGRFVPVNCATLSPELVASELFGHEKGAFTGADRNRKGLVSLADSGTLFLDEIGDMPAETQLALLRLLQEKCIRPVGSDREIPVDVRVVAATHVQLDDAVREGRFREDLFYRLDVIRMDVPSLHRRPEDIILLFGHFMRRLSKHYGVRLPTYTESFLDQLIEYRWPGNIRQLENFAERVVLSRPTRPLTGRDFAEVREPQARVTSTQIRPESSPETQPLLDPQQPLTPQLEAWKKQAERDYLEALLTRHEGRIERSASAAGIDRRTLLRMLQRHGIDKRRFRMP